MNNRLPTLEQVKLAGSFQRRRKARKGHSRWKHCPTLKEIDNASGVYAIYIAGKLVYVGSSEALRYRLYTHISGYGLEGSLVKTPWGMFPDVRVKVKYSRYLGDFLALEYRLIQRLRPTYNKRSNPDKMGYRRPSLD
jgi:excinuclease UvrABC nuclease subunit